jgi:sigma-B regulation protein RsbU (phosphoserine phosphatase)
MPGTKYSDVEIKLNKGDKLFLYTDGVPEATNADKKMFTFDRMLKSLNDNKEKSPQEILESVYSDVNDFVGDAPQFDDLTMLCFEYKGKLSEITLKATFENVEKAIDFISDKSEELPFDVKEKNKIKIAMDEIMSNVVQYAYQGSEGDVTIKADPGDDDFTITVIDSGIKYNPLGKEDPDTTLSAEEREVGGYGIFLVKKIMDEIEYEYKDGKNILTMKKKFNK